MQFTKKNCLSIYYMRPTQYMLNILPAILFPASACFRQQTNPARIGMISHRSQVHQIVPSNRSFTSSFPLSSRLETFWFKTERLKIIHVFEYMQNHSRPQRPRSFWSALKITTSGQRSWFLVLTKRIAASGDENGFACTRGHGWSSTFPF